LLPGWGGTQRLQRLIGESAAKQVVFTAERLPAERMHEFGYSTKSMTKTSRSKRPISPPIFQNMSEIAIYARVSTDQQDATRQVEDCRRVADRRDATVSLYVDRGISGAEFDRPEFQRLIQETMRETVGCDRVEAVAFFLCQFYRIR
jgi:enoyl-CoA hydratase/carnithine racemase